VPANQETRCFIKSLLHLLEAGYISCKGKLNPSSLLQTGLDGAWEQLEFHASVPVKIPERVVKVRWSSFRGQPADGGDASSPPDDTRAASPAAAATQVRRTRAASVRNWDTDAKRIRSAVDAALRDRNAPPALGADGWTVGLPDMRRELASLRLQGADGSGGAGAGAGAGFPVRLLYCISHPPQ
jgi:hypothetical protein